MYTHLATVTLKTGEKMKIGVIHAPDPEYADQIRQFLSHKPGNFKRHIDQCLVQALDELETRFYVGLQEGKIISQVMIVEYAGVGILGHVFTHPEHRRKGACGAIMAQQMDDFRRRGSQFLLLGTSFESPPYWIYYRFGFRSVTGDSGFMYYATSEDFATRWFAPAPARIVEVKWRHWPTLNVLLGWSEGDFIRNMALGLLGRVNFEGGFLTFRETLEEQNAIPGELPPQAKLLETEIGAVVGCATLWPDPSWPRTYLLDVFMHPHFAAKTDSLVAALPPVKAKTLAYAEASAEAKNAALERAGFRCEGRLIEQLCPSVGKAEDVLIWGR